MSNVVASSVDVVYPSSVPRTLPFRVTTELQCVLVTRKMSRLVITCEELLQREQQAWRSTSQSVKLLQKYSREASSNGGGAQQLE